MRPNFQAGKFNSASMASRIILILFLSKFGIIERKEVCKMFRTILPS